MRREIEIKPICTDCLLQIAQAFCGTIHTVEEKHRLAVSPLKFSFRKKAKGSPPRSRGEGTKNTSCGNVKKQKRNRKKHHRDFVAVPKQAVSWRRTRESEAKREVKVVGQLQRVFV